MCIHKHLAPLKTCTMITLIKRMYEMVHTPIDASGQRRSNVVRDMSQYQTRIATDVYDTPADHSHIIKRSQKAIDRKAQGG